MVSSKFLCCCFAFVWFCLNICFVRSQEEPTSNVTSDAGNGRHVFNRDVCPFGVKSYVGCYLTGPDEFNQTTPFYTLNADETDYIYNADQCACTCGKLGYQYAAMQTGTDCYCDNSYGAYGTSQDCVAVCADDPSELCGGSDFSVNSVYQTTVGCDPSCNANQTCTNFGDFYWCVPDCDFTASLDYSLPCGNTGNVVLTVSGGGAHSTEYNVSIDGAAATAGNINSSATYSFTVGETHNFTISNSFGCSVNRSVTLPVPTLPNIMDAPILIFDVASMQVAIMWFKLIYPSRTGGLQLSKYIVEYRYHCPNGTFSDWIQVNATAASESVSVPFEYDLEYEAKVYAENCMGAADFSSSSVLLAPSSPYQPQISQITPTGGVSTTGGSITITGSFFTSQPTLFADGVTLTPTSATASQIVVALGAGVGTPNFAVRSSANYTCQQMTSPNFPYSYSVPIILSSSVLSNAGGVLTVTGNNFGASGNFSVSIDEILCQDCTREVDHAKVACSGCPAGNGDGHSLVVEVQGLVSNPYAFTYAECDPMCVFGECINNNVCSCEDGYGGSDCSEVRVCAGAQAFSASTCGECVASSETCCVFMGEP